MEAASAQPHLCLPPIPDLRSAPHLFFLSLLRRKRSIEKQ
jgi:hypothetical protein